MKEISYVNFKEVSKKYKESKVEVLKDFNLSIEKGEFIVIVGPSGSGKSTLLELICGFEELTTGTIEIDSKVINDVMPKDRDVSMVFQNYALMPHLTAYENIGFGMKIRKESKLEIDRKVNWAAKILGIEEYLDVKPKNLSGGQRQRIALARSMVREPKLFLMDEPLSNLDSKLRYTTCNEITNLHKEINATTIYVTHDQVEALTMADRIVVLNEGKVQQVGTSIEVYSNPKNIFVASFIGKPQINLFNFIVKENKLEIANCIFIDKEGLLLDLKEGEKYIIGIRSEYIKIVDSTDNNSIEATIEKVEYLGGEIILYLRYKECAFTTKTYEVKEYKVGQNINVRFKLDKVNVFDYKTKENLRRD